MRNLEFYTSRFFSLIEKEGINYEDSDYIILGVPYDSTVSYKPGARFGPDKIRESFYELETFDFETGLDFEDINVYDAGNFSFEVNADNIVKKIRNVVSEIVEDDKIPVLLGGEHTITLGGIEGIIEMEDDIVYVVFDAHLDMRDEYPLGNRLTHATVNRRIIEKIGLENIVIAGVRACSKEEYDFIRKNKIKVYGVDEKIRMDFLRDKNVYVSIDLDVLDPSIAPGVGNPEPLGISLYRLMDLLRSISKYCNIKAFDIVELNPLYDNNGITVSVASKILQKLIIYIEKYKNVK